MTLILVVSAASKYHGELSGYEIAAPGYANDKLAYRKTHIYACAARISASEEASAGLEYMLE